MPEELKKIVDDSFSTSRLGNKGHYQGSDACLEEINKNGKSWVSPHGVPTNEEWLKVFRNLYKLNKVRTILMSVEMVSNPFIPSTSSKNKSCQNNK